MFPDKLMVGMEIRVKVSDYVTDRIVALRSQQPGQFNNVACLRLGKSIRGLPQVRQV